MKQERAWETICSTFSVDLYPIVHRRSQDHILNRVRNLCPHPMNVVRMTIMQYLEELFFLFVGQGLSLTNSAGGTLTLAFFMTT
jgi:hypothetical protein